MSLNSSNVSYFYLIKFTVLFSSLMWSVYLVSFFSAASSCVHFIVILVIQNVIWCIS